MARQVIISNEFRPGAEVQLYGVSQNSSVHCFEFRNAERGRRGLLIDRCSQPSIFSRITRCPHRFRRELFRLSFRTVFRDAQLHWVRFCSVTEHKSIIVMSHDVIGQVSQFHYVPVFLTSQPFALEHFSFLI